MSISVSTSIFTHSPTGKQHCETFYIHCFHYLCAQHKDSQITSNYLAPLLSQFASTSSLHYVDTHKPQIPLTWIGAIKMLRFYIIVHNFKWIKLNWTKITNMHESTHMVLGWQTTFTRVFSTSIGSPSDEGGHSMPHIIKLEYPHKLDNNSVVSSCKWHNYPHPSNSCQNVQHWGSGHLNPYLL